MNKIIVSFCLCAFMTACNIVTPTSTEIPEAAVASASASVEPAPIVVSSVDAAAVLDGGEKCRVDILNFDATLPSTPTSVVKPVASVSASPVVKSAPASKKTIK